MSETAAERQARDVESQSDDRKLRNYQSQPQARLEREYVHSDGSSLWDYVDALNA